MQMAPLPQEQHYTYADLLEWDDDVRYELYSGVPIALASPTDLHQVISGELFAQLHAYLKGKKCRVYYAPLDVRLFEEDGDRPEDVDTVLQPDLMVVCDPNKVDRHGVHGAPDMVIEIISKSTFRLDRLTKLNLYQRAGVREYWIVDPFNRIVSVYSLKDGVYRATAYTADSSSIEVGVLDGCTIDLSTVFPEV